MKNTKLVNDECCGGCIYYRDIYFGGHEMACHFCYCTGKMRRGKWINTCREKTVCKYTASEALKLLGLSDIAEK